VSSEGEVEVEEEVEEDEVSICTYENEYMDNPNKQDNFISITSDNSYNFV